MLRLYSFLVLSFLLGFTTFAQTELVFRSIALPDASERVTGIYCTSATSCVVSTDGSSGVGHVYATDGQTITATLLTGDSAFADTIGTLGTVDFMGFSKVGDTLIALVDGAGTGFVSSTGDITQPASWSAVEVGVLDGGEIFGLNQQMGFGMKDNRWIYFSHRTLYESTDGPSPSAFWQPLWSPMAQTPGNFDEQYQADPTLCAAEPGVSIQPKLTQPGYIAPDLSVMLYPAGSRNQASSVGPGVCLSTDGGKSFYHIAFTDVGGDLGPLGVTCSSTDNCFAYGGLEYEADSVYIYYTNNAGQGAGSSWTRAALPTLRDNSRFRGMAFQSDGMTGWVVGADDSSSPLLLTTGDSGETWKDATSLVRALAPDSRLHTVYVFDDEHVWLGGENGTLLTSGK